jgi:NAD(P)-dependent dehydrogenase (short-subunit alcohol dehydrogenase family)
LVSNAAVLNPRLLLETQVEDWDRMFHINTRATWLLGKAAHSALEQSRGAIVAVGSISGGYPHPGHAAYSPSKTALEMLCRLMALEWARDGIRVNLVSPGMIKTPLTEAVYRDSDLTRQRNELVPMGRVGETEDIVGAIAFLCGPESLYVTGQNIYADGGLTDSILSHIPGFPQSRLR